MVVVVVVVTGADARCSLLYVLSVARKPKCLSSLVEIDQYIVLIATTKAE